MIFNPFERMVAWRYLRARKSEGFVSVIAGFSFAGIMLGVATLIIVMSVMNGFRAELVGRILGLNGHINVYAPNGALSNYMGIVDRLEKIPGVQSVRPMIEGQVLISVNGTAHGAAVRAFAREDFATKPILSNSIIAGQLTQFRDQQVAIGIKLAEKLGLTLGSEITLLAPKGRASPFGTIPRSRQYSVGLIFDVGMYEYNSNFIFMDIISAQQFFQMKNQVHSIEVMAKDTEHADPLKEKINQELGGSIKIYDWRHANKTFLTALEVERNVMFLILTLIILVAAFNIISSMIMLVKDKGKDIAILRTMGASKGSVLKIFTLTGASIGFLGTLMGAILGIAFSLNIETIRQFLEGVTNTELFADEIYFLSKLPAVVDWHDVLGIVFMAFLISILATIYPAWRASRLDPVEALRYE